MPFPNTVILDTFVRANENPLTATNWGIRRWSGHKIVSNEAVPVVDAGGEYPESAWKTAFSSDHEVYVTLNTIHTVESIGIGVIYRCQTSNTWDDYFRVYAYRSAGNDALNIDRIVATVSVTIFSNAIGREWVSGDTIGASVFGSTHTLYINGVSFGTVEDSTLLTGNYIGILNEASVVPFGFRNFGGGSLSGNSSGRIRELSALGWNPALGKNWR